MNERNDRNLGYAVMVFLGFFVTVTTVYFSYRLQTPVHLRTIVFEEANSPNFLREQDPVKVRGVEAGTVHDISWREGKTYVAIKTRQRLDIRRGYTIIAKANGLMGDRYLTIDPGPTGSPGVDANEILHGTFPMGPAESIAYAGILRRKVDSFSVFISELRAGSAKGRPFETRFSQISGELDGITCSLLRLFRATDRLLDNKGDSLSAFMERVNDIANSIAVSTPRALATLETIMGKTQNLLVLADTLLASSDTLVLRMTGPEAVELDKKFRELRRTAELLKRAVIELREEGIKFKLRIRNGKK